MDIVFTERMLGVHGLISRALGTPLQLKSAETSEANTTSSLFLSGVGLLLGIIIAVIVILIQNVAIGWLATWVLVKFAGLNYEAFFSVFPAAYVYLTFFNRLGLVSIFAREGATPVQIGRMFFAIFLLLPAAFYLTRYGIVVAGQQLGVDTPDYSDMANVREYLLGFSKPEVIASLASGVVGILFFRR